MRSTALDFSLRAMSMIGLILKNYPFPEKHIFLHKIAYGLGQDISCIKFLVVSDFKVIFKCHMQKKQTFLNLRGLP